MTARNAIGWLTAGLAVLAGTVLYRVADTALLPTAHWSGWTLALAFLLLGVHGVHGIKRRWPGPVRLLVHLHLGWIAALLFLVHGTLPGFSQGAFHGILSLSFAAALASGAAGLCLERFCTHRQRDWDALPWPRIAQERGVLAAQAGAAFHEIVKRGCPPLLARLYAQRLLPFLSRPAHLWQHCIGHRRPLEDLLQELSHAGRPLADHEDFLRIRDIVVRKDHLDQRRALYWLQRGWLFVHLPAAAVAAVFAVFHVIFVYSFGG